MSVLSSSRIVVLGAAISLPLALTACGGDDGDNQAITIASVPSEESTSLEGQYSNVIAALEQELGVEVNFQNAADYSAVIEGQRAGQVDIASYGPFSYVIARDTGVNVDVLGVASDEAGQPGGYTSRAYKLADNDEINSLEDARDKTVCFVDQASTSGYLVPSAGLLEAGVDPKIDVTEQMTGGHDSSLLALADGGCDIAFAFDAQEETLIDSGQLEEGKLAMIWESDAIPSSPITLSNDSDLDPELAEKIQTTFAEKINKPSLVEMGICDSEEDCELPDDMEYGYINVDDDYYDSIRDICDLTQAEACNQLDS